MKMIRKKIFICVGIFAILILGLCGILGMQKKMEELKIEEFNAISDGVYEAVENEISKPISISSVMAKDIFLMDFLKKETEYSEKDAVELISRYLSSLKEATGFQTAFVISDATKRYYSYDGLNKVINIDQDNHDIWYSIFINSKKKYDLDVDHDQINEDKWTVFINTRITDEDGKLLGVCGLGMAMDNLQAVLRRYEQYYGIEVDFINSDGTVQLGAEEINIENAYLHNVQYGKEKDGYAYKNNKNEYVIMKYVEDLNWYLLFRGNYKKL